MSQDDRNNIGPGWDDTELDWLEDLLREAPSSRKEAPARSEPSFSFDAAVTDGAPRPTDTARVPETSSDEAAVAGERASAAGPADRADRIRAAAYEPYESAARGKEKTAEKKPRAAAEAAADFDELEEVLGADSRRSRIGLPLILVIVVLVLGMLFAGWQLGSIFLNYHRDRSAYNDLAQSAISSLAESEKHARDAVPGDEAAEGEETKVRVVSEVPIQVDWDYLRSVNDDVVGWLYCPGTVINYPVVQSSDHEFYLNHGFDKSHNTSGTLFADMDSVAGVALSNYIIYGHNMKDDSMFGTFQKYVDKSYYEQNPIMYFLTPQGSYRVELFGAHMVESYTENFPTYFSDENAYMSYLDGISPSFYWFQKDKVDTKYQLMTLSTCTSGAGFSDARLLLHGVMIPVQ